MELQLFALKHSEDFGKKISEHLEIPLSPIEERVFSDGEWKLRPLESVRGREVFVVHSLFSEKNESIHDKLCKLLFFISTLKDCSAKKVTAVIPYFPYARKDQKTKDRDPITLKYVCHLLERSGADQILTMDIHHLSAYQNAFRIPTEHLEARILFIRYFEKNIREENLVVVSPDVGGIKRAESFGRTLTELYHREVGQAYLNKERVLDKISFKKHTEGFLIGGVKDKTAILIDDLISSGETLKLALDALEKEGALKAYACVTHGPLSPEGFDLLDHPLLEKLYLTNTIVQNTHHLSPKHLEKLVIADISVLFSKAMKRMEAGDSLCELQRSYPFVYQELSQLS